MPTLRISESNWQRLQTWAVPLVDSVDNAFARVLDAAEMARKHGLIAAGTLQTPDAGILPRITEKHKLEQELNAALANETTAILEKQGKSMIRWRSNGKLRKRFWVTTNGSGLIYLPNRGGWATDTGYKVVHHPNPKSGWEHYDWLYLKEHQDVSYTLQILRVCQVISIAI